MTITQLIDELQAIYREHGDVEVFEAKGGHPFVASRIDVVTVDDWSNSTTERHADGADYEIPARVPAVELGRRM